MISGTSVPRAILKCDVPSVVTQRPLLTAEAALDVPKKSS